MYFLSGIHIKRNARDQPESLELLYRIGSGNFLWFASTMLDARPHQADRVTDPECKLVGTAQSTRN